MRKWMVVLSLIFGVALQSAQAQSYVLYAAAGVKSPMENILEIFTKKSGAHFELHFDTAGAAQMQYFADPKAQLLITTQERIEASIGQAQLKEGRMIPLAATMAGIASHLERSEAIKTKEELKALLLSAKSIAFSDPDRGATVGQHFIKVIRSLGIEQEVLAKAQKAREGLQTMQWVKEGRVELGVTQVSEIVQAAPRTLVGPFPQEFDLSTNYALWIKEPEEPIMKALCEWLQTKEAKDLMASQGLRPLN